MSTRRVYDESDARVRPGRSSRPRTKTRPAHLDAETAMVISVDRGRWGCVLDGDPRRPVVAMRAREMGRTPVVVGDLVSVVGDLSGTTDTLARIVAVHERRTVLRRTADDTDPYERVVVANADRVLVVVALADPPPRTGLIDRCLVAAFVGGLTPVLCLTKADLADPAEITGAYAELDVQVLALRPDSDLAPLRAVLDGRVTCLVGHSGVGKSTLVNRLLPQAHRAVGLVSGIGRGRHTSTQSVALALPDGGWVVDTPGIRSFGLAHVRPDDVVAAFDDLAAAAASCPRGCTHLGPPADPECALDSLTGPAARRVPAGPAPAGDAGPGAVLVLSARTRALVAPLGRRCRSMDPSCRGGPGTVRREEFLVANVPLITLNNGVQIPQLGFGVFQIEPEDTKEAVLTAFEIGYRHIDTAEMYGNEAEVGRAIEASGLPRSEVFVTSKLNNGYHDPDDAMKAIRESLDKLGIDALDLFLIHWPLPDVGDYLDTWRAMEDMQQQGLTRAIGVSNFQTHHLQRLAEAGTTTPTVNQIEVHPYFRNEKVRAYGAEHQIATEAWSPIAQGGVLDDETISAVAEQVGRTTAQVTLRWHIQRGDIIFPKSVTPERMKQNFELFDFELNDEQMGRVDGVDRNERTGPDPDTFNMIPD